MIGGSIDGRYTGNCWLTRYLDRWDFKAIAVDIHTSAVDGLQAGRQYLAGGAAFSRVRAEMEWLPFASGTITLLATNAAFHYATDFRSTLSEFERVLTPGGKIVIVDTPFYEQAADGERMMAERVVEFRRKYGMAEALARRSKYLTFGDFGALLQSMNLKWRMHRVWPGFRRRLDAFRARLKGRRLAEFPVVVIEKVR